MNWVDFALAIIFLLAVWAGYHRGFILGSLDLLSWAGSFIAAYMLFDYTKVFLEKLFNLGVWLLPVSFIVTLLAARLVFGVILSFITRRLPEQSNHNFFNKFLGILLGMSFILFQGGNSRVVINLLRNDGIVDLV